MRDDMYENNWSPFDPKWYEAAFDQFISTADQLFNQDLIIKQGFNIPDKDGSKSSIFRNEAVLNNSFNEIDLRETLKDIYLNSSHKLIASNNDNVHFYQWYGSMSDMTLIPNTDICEFSIPTSTFIFPKERDKFKLSQFYRKWIKIEDILNNWEIFKWSCMLFINQKIYSEYELKIDDHETKIRFKYYNYWVKMNYPIYIYKFDTNASCRILISKELCKNQWNWKLPVEYINDKRVINSNNVIVSFNKISDQNIRNDGLTHIDVLGDNLEFLKIENGYIDISNISNFNKALIESENEEWLWMSIIIPKFLYEYPIMLPTDIIYRPYEADFKKVTISDNMGIRNVKSDNSNDEMKQVYIDMNGKLEEDHNCWKQMIRPIVLSDCFNDPFNEPYMSFIEELRDLKDLTVKGADTIEEFRFFMLDNPTNDEFYNFVDKLINDINNIHNAYNTFLKKRLITTDKIYEFEYKKFHNIMEDIKRDGIYSEWFSDKNDGDFEKDFWFSISPQIYIPREMYDKHSIVYLIKSIKNNGILWKDIDDLIGKQRFRRPVDESNFWTFEYDVDDQVWRPYHLNIDRHFPDVYLLNDPLENNASLNRIFKAFFFYSDTMNVLDQTGDIINATPSWDKDMQEYEYVNGAIYRDIFMEKFYWMGVRSIYKEILITKSRWEVIEYVIDNESYDRFNKLFLNTMDPYFKMGLATYLKSSNYGFPFDDIVDKFTESINQDYIGYKKVNNFELYLNKNWVPSYFDNIIKIMDDWECNDRLIRRPRSSFDILRLLPLLIDIQNNIFISVNNVDEILKWILSKLKIENYNLNVKNIIDIESKVNQIVLNIKYVYKFTNDLDLDIYGLSDLNHIIDKLKYHMILIDELEELFNNTRQNVHDNNFYLNKKEILQNIYTSIDEFYNIIILISDIVQDFDMEGFMKAVNDLYTYFEYNKNNPDDKSLIGYINKFNDPWSIKVKELRNNLFQSTSVMYGNFNPNKAYKNNEVIEFINIIENVKTDIELFSNSISEFWVNMGYNEDQIVIDKFDNVISLFGKLTTNMNIYMNNRNKLIDIINIILKKLEEMDEFNISDTEINYRNNIKVDIDNIILSLSYIAGINNKKDAIDNFNLFKNHLTGWDSYIKIEEEVFIKLINFTEPPIQIIEKLNNDELILNKMIEYMDSANIEYIPDSGWPTYSSVYSVDEIELISGGFYNQVGEFVAVPKLGSYKISEVSEETFTVKCIEQTGYRNTTFRDPMIQSNLYDTVTNGRGMGITLKPINSNKIPIINDDIIRNFITRIQNSCYLVSININTPNPYNNNSYKNSIEGIKNIKSDWDNVVNIYKDNMSVDAYNYIDNLINILLTLIDPSENLIEVRSNIDLDGIIIDIDKLITDNFILLNDQSLVDQNYYYYEEKLKILLTDLEKFYGNGSMWSDSSKLKELLNESKYTIRLFKIKVIDIISDESKYNINELIDNLFNKISITEDTLNSIPNLIIDISPIIRRIENNIKEMPLDLIKKDTWYRMININIALEGDGYKIGDVLSIIPELPRDKNGNPITDMEDIILNDVIFIRVKEVIDGRVTVLEPLIDYAIPYLIWGIRETNTVIGNGKGLTVDIYSKEIELSDITLFNDNESDISTLPQYNENDMFVFKFENIHDLNIQYEIFYGGKQITNFFHRHIQNTDKLHPSNIDVLYLNANEVSDLKNSSIYIPAEHYFVYKLDNIDIKDPGTGYAVGQEIFIDLDILCLKLKITKLIEGPYKGISEVEIEDIRINQEFDNPSCMNAEVVTDSLNNIDDEFNNGYYDTLTQDGIVKAATLSFDEIEYPFFARRFDSIEDGNRNSKFMYPDVNMPLVEEVPQNGDPDYNFYLGNRIDNSKHPMSDIHRWNGIMNVIPPTDPFITDDKRVPTNKPIKGEYQLIAHERIHNSINEINDDVTKIFEKSIKNAAMVEGDFIVQKFSQLPKHMNDWPTASIGKCVIVENDETNNGHRMMYRLRTFVAAGFFVYDLPEIADYKWNNFYIDWTNCDCYPDYPSIKSKYSDANWYSSKTYLDIQRSIIDNEYIDRFPIMSHCNNTYIDNITIDDISVWNCNKCEWENLHDESKWKLEKIDNINENKWGFILSYLEEGLYSYDMILFLNKIPDNQVRNSLLKRNAIMDVIASIVAEVNKPAINMSVNTGRHLRIRKLFPYEQKETFTIGKNPDGSYTGYEMNIKVAPYIHFRNELHLEDVKIYNKSAGRFENILDPKMFEVRFKDDRAIDISTETHTRIIQTIISDSGEGFVDGDVWGYNEEFNINVFGVVTTNYKTTGNILTFKPTHCVNPPTENIALEFKVYQRDNQTDKQMAIIIIEFNTETIQVRGDGYIHNITNRLAPLPKEFKIICQYNLDTLADYDIIISKSPRQWKFIEPKWMVSPTFHIDDYNIQQDRVYILTSNGRFPLRNPSTGKPSINVVQTDNGTDVTFLNIYKRYEHIEVRTVPYPMRSVYVQRHIPESGYIDLSGKINKPLNKKYFEFWVNGKLLYDEVTIITPTKIFLHGLKSLKNLEIIEINRDSNEYFSDIFLDVKFSEFGRPSKYWDYETYLDAALEGTLDGDNYTIDEQEYLLSPVWRQVEKDHPEFKNYPPNVDTEPDVLARVSIDDYPLDDLDDPVYQFMIINTPTLEGFPIVDRTLNFEHFGFTPITDSMIIDIMNNEWKDEIESDPYFYEHSVMNDDEWYGMTTRLYDEYGIRVHTLDESAYSITDDNLLRINTENKLSRIVKNNIIYDLE